MFFELRCFLICAGFLRRNTHYITALSVHFLFANGSRKCYKDAVMKKTVQQKLADKKYKIPNALVYKLLYKLVVKGSLEKKYNPTYEIKDSPADCKGPCFVIYNHQSRIEYVWLMHACYPRRLNFMVGYNEFFRSHLKFILRLAHAIPKKNFVLDLPAMKAVDTLVKKGAAICFSPEGMSSISGHNQPVVNGLGRFFKKYNIPVYIVRLSGAYLTNTKYCLDERKGLIKAKAELLYSPEYLKSATPEEIEERTNRELTHDDYLWNKKEQISYDGHGRLAHNLEQLCYVCPNCGKEFALKGEGDEISCRECGFKAKLDDKYNLIPVEKADKLPATPSAWFDMERKQIRDMLHNNPDYVFEMRVKLGRLPSYSYVTNMKTSIPCGEGVVIIDKEGFHYEGYKDDEPTIMELDYEHIWTFGMPLDASYVSFYYNGDYYDLFPESGYAIKMLLVLEEFHRLMANKWKRLESEAWMDE